MHLWDRTLFLWLNLDPGDPDAIVMLAMLASKWLPNLVLAALAVVLMCGPARVRLSLAPVAGAMALAWLGADLLKDTIVAPRPYLQGLGTDWLGRTGASGFPSSHASIALAFAAAAWLNPWPVSVRLACLGAALLIAWSRLALGAHFPSDVAGAAVLGAVSALVAHTAVLRLTRARQRKAAVPITPPDQS